MARQVPDSPEGRRNFIPDDPTEDPDFDPSKWTGTILSGLISTRTECNACGNDWHDGDCSTASVCGECGKGIGHFLTCSQHEEHPQSAAILAAMGAEAAEDDAYRRISRFPDGREEPR